MKIIRNTNHRRPGQLYGLVVLMAWVVTVSTVQADGLSGNNVEQDALQSLRLEPPVNLDFDGQPLREAVTLVNQRSGISFQLADGVRDTPVRQRIAATGWNQAVAELLKGFSFLGIIDDKGMYRRVIVTGISGDGRDSEPTDVDQNLDDRAGVMDSAVPDREPINRPTKLWQGLLAPLQEFKAETGIPSRPIQLLVEGFDDVDVGQPLQLDIPQEEFPVYGVVSDLQTELDGHITVWSGPVDGAHETASFTMTRGQKMTYITVATGESIYEISIENATGNGIVINEEDLTRGKLEDDVVHVTVP